MPDPGKVFVHPAEDNHGDNEPDSDPDNSPGVHPRKVGPGAVHPEAGDRHHGPDAAQLGGQHRAPGVPVTRVPGSVTRTNLAIMTINNRQLIFYVSSKLRS